MTRHRMPETGTSQASLIEALRARKHGDADWQQGRVPLFVFKASDEISQVGRAAFFEYFDENALGAARAFPSVKQMEKEVVEMALELLHAPPQAQGFMSTGGTESIIQAVQTCRDWTRARRGEPGLRGNIVAPESVHPAFDKAARLMDLEVRRIPVAADFRADVAAMRQAIDAETLMLVGSAPCFSYGMVDPIEELAALARERDLWLHVDACVGGYVAPFARLNGRPVPAFDLGIEGVSSLSADLHKFGFCPKPASTVFYADADRARFHAFEFSNWPNGRFATSTLCGTRPAGGVAAAWAVFNFLGIEGYRCVAAELMEFVDDFRARVLEIPGMRIVGDPHLSIVAYTADDIDIFQVAERMEKEGYVPGLLRQPKALHRMMSMVHETDADAYLDALRRAVEAQRKQAAPSHASIEATY